MSSTSLTNLRAVVEFLQNGYRSRAKGPKNTSARAARLRAQDLSQIRKWWSPNIAGFGIGRKCRDRDQHELQKLVVRFHVYRKVDESRLPAGNVIPKKIRLEHLGIEVATDVREVKGAPLLHALTAGEEVGHFSGEAGTAGVFVRTLNDPGPFLLSCAHVFTPPGTSGIDDAIESPMDTDSLKAVNQVGVVVDTFGLRSSGINECDAAMARIEGVDPSNQIPGVTVPTSLLDFPKSLIGRPVSQFGAATGQTVSGPVRDESITKSFNFRGQSFTFSNLVEYRVRSKAGDSGAAVVDDETGEVLGLHIGAETGTSNAYFSPMNLIVDRFGVILL